jgi:hypothetical protein
MLWYCLNEKETCLVISIDGCVYLILELHAAKIVAARGESLGAMETTTPRSSPLSASTMTKSPGLMPRGAEEERIKQR